MIALLTSFAYACRDLFRFLRGRCAGCNAPLSPMVSGDVYSTRPLYCRRCTKIALFGQHYGMGEKLQRRSQDQAKGRAI